MEKVGGAKSPVVHFLESGGCSFLAPAHTSWSGLSVGGDRPAYHGFSEEPQLSLCDELMRREKHIFVQ